MSELIKYLESFSTPEEAVNSITEELGVKVKHYPEEDLYVFNYSQIDSPKAHPVVMDCRGAILEFDNGWKYVCRPFKRFFNYGEAPDTLTDFSFNRSEVFEKVDGSLIKIYRWRGEWRIATRGTAFAETENNLGLIFYEMVLDAFGLSLNEFHALAEWNLTREMTHLFELVHKDNRIVTPYENNEMVYLGSVDNDTGEFSFGQCLFGNSREAASFFLDSFDSCVEASKSLSGLEEGYVVRDMKSGQAVKIKSPLYVAAHHLRGELGLTPKKIAKLVVTNETEEYLRYFPEDHEKIYHYAFAWQHVRSEAVAFFYRANLDTETQKEFAMAVKDHRLSGAMFTARKAEKGLLHAIDNMRESAKIDILLGAIDD